MADESRNVHCGDSLGSIFQIGKNYGDVNVSCPGHSQWYRVLGIVLVVGAALGGPGVTSVPLSSQSQRSPSPEAQSQVIAPPASQSPASQPGTPQSLAQQSQKPQHQPARPQPSPLQVAKEKLVNACANKRVDQRSREGGPVGYTPGLVYEIVVQNPNDTEIVLTGLRADVARRHLSPAGDLDAPPGGCRFWTDLPVRDLVLNLDVERPRAVAAERVETDGDYSMQLPKSGAPRKSFPYKVLKGESEVLHVGFETSRCDCEFQLVVEAVAGGESAETVLSTVHRVVPKGQ